mgnify:CR=1 FL=1|tara:strand:- start:900 stop:1490 length:591 start_codon:yes stop_codon:yes gene_type:complete
MTQPVRNILKVYRRATTDDIANGVEWYDRAKRYADTISKKTGVHLHTVIGVMAALSPNNKWERNVADCERMCGSWSCGFEIDDFKVSCYNTMKQKAWSILDDNLTSDDDILARLNGQKIRSFYSNIRGLDEVTIDGHALNIALGKLQGLTTDKTNMSKGVYIEMQKHYVRAAKRVDIPAHVLQAITWTTWKRENNI